MEQVKLLRRRTTDLLANAQQNIATTQKGFFASAQENLAHAQKNLPALSMPHFGLRGQSSPADHGPKGTWELIDNIPALRRSAHPLDIIAGSAYIFGGELNGQIADNDMHVVRLPVSGASTDYYRIAAAAAKPDEADADEHGKTASEASSDGAGSEAGSSSPRFRGKGKERAIDIVRPDLGDVPAARAGHATAVIGSRILLFGGRGADGKPIEEAGRVWVFDTRTCTWSHLDPAPAVMGGAITIHPNARSDHCAAATDKPQDFGSSRTTTSSPPTAPHPPPSTPTTLRSRAQGWRDWAVGDTSKTGIPQDPVVGQVAESAVDEESRGYGTLFIHAGRLNNGSGSNDIWAFDVRSRMWTELPSAPGPARADTAICISKSRLFRFGGADASNGEKLGGQLDYLHLEVDIMDGKTEVGVRARDGWQTILQRPTSTYSSTVTPSEPLLASPRSTNSAPEIPVDGGVHPWPCPRSGAVFEAMTMGGGREVLVLAFGERGTDQPPLDDVWLFQAPPQGMSAASVTAAVLQAVGRKTGEGRWARVVTRPYDDDDDEAGKGWAALPQGRALLASAPMTNLEDSGVLVWGGVGEDGETFGDGWVLRL
ncbi:Tip elongation aberrant protein 1 [Beauveria bassiana]|nr:Tip elongation aberrant protein 1 [Beauveria bassiana]KAH8711466.1 Tip elongation aberrant protein 1 [Beauveria bassiana]